MIDDVIQKSKTDPEMKKVKDALWEKSLRGMKSNPNRTMNFEYKDSWTDGKSAIRHVIDRENKRVRDSQ